MAQRRAGGDLDRLAGDQLLILLVAFSMSELASAMPTAGGIYYWASKLGGPGWGWFTGWFNLIGLVAVTASVDYAAATFLNSTLSFYGAAPLRRQLRHRAACRRRLHHTFVLFVLILFVHALINIFSSHLVALLTNVSVWWHVIGVCVIIVILIAVPSHHQSFSFVFGHRINLSGFSSHMYWFYVLPLGFLLTMYTITGYDASAHISEETHGAAEAAPKGVWRSVFYSAVFGWAVLLALTFAATHVSTINAAGGTSQSIIETRAELGGRQGGAGDLDRRPAVLRDGVRDQRLADDVRVLARRRGPRPQPVAPAGQEPDADLGGGVRGRVRAHHHDPGLQGQPRSVCRSRSSRSPRSR